MFDAICSKERAFPSEVGHVTTRGYDCRPDTVVDIALGCKKEGSQIVSTFAVQLWTIMTAPQILKALFEKMAAAGQCPDIVESPDNRTLQTRKGMQGEKTVLDPVQMNNIRIQG